MPEHEVLWDGEPTRDPEHCFWPPLSLGSIRPQRPRLPAQWGSASPSSSLPRLFVVTLLSAAGTRVVPLTAEDEAGPQHCRR